MAVEYGYKVSNNTNNTDLDEIEEGCIYDSSNFVIKDKCIARQFSTIYSPHNTIIQPQSYIYYCDQDQQTISYQGWDNADCSGHALQDEPIVVVDYNSFDSPEGCVELICDGIEMPNLH